MAACTKHRHATPAHAHAARRAMIARQNGAGTDTLVVYACASCKAWHIGNRFAGPHRRQQRVLHVIDRALDTDQRRRQRTASQGPHPETPPPHNDGIPPPNTSA